MGSKAGLLDLVERIYQQGAVQIARAVAPEAAPLIARLSPNQATGIGLALPTGGASLALLFRRDKGASSGFDLFAGARGSPSSTRSPGASKPSGGLNIDNLLRSADQAERTISQAQKTAKLLGLLDSSSAAPPSS